MNVKEIPINIKTSINSALVNEDKWGFKVNLLRLLNVCENEHYHAEG